MRVLLDSHTFIWLADEPERLSKSLRDRLLQANLFLSVVSEWELLIKQQKGKLRLRMDISEMIEREMEAWQLQRLPVVHPHIRQYAQLPLHHRDPFDRMLIAQAIAEDLTLVTADAAFRHYNVKTIL